MAHGGRIYNDVAVYSPSGRELESKGLCAGFPCQGVSQAGMEGGLSDARTGLLRHCWRIFDLLPQGEFIVLENVANLRSRAMSEIMRYIMEARFRIMCHVPSKPSPARRPRSET